MFGEGERGLKSCLGGVGAQLGAGQVHMVRRHHLVKPLQVNMLAHHLLTNSGSDQRLFVRVLLGRVNLLAANDHARHRCHLHICLSHGRLLPIPIFSLRKVGMLLNCFIRSFHCGLRQLHRLGHFTLQRCLYWGLVVRASEPHVRVDVVE